MGNYYYPPQSRNPLAGTARPGKPRAMKRTRLLIALLLLGCLLLPQAASAQTATDREYVQDITFARNNLNSYWSGQFKKWKVKYAPPTRIVAYTKPIRNTSCGYIPRNNAGYCPSNNSIYYDDLFMKQYFREVGDFAPVVVLAHEWGHLVQYQFLRAGYKMEYLGYDITAYPLYMELQADCLAGVWSEHTAEIGWLEAGDVEEATISLYGAGDNENIPWFDPRAHGQPGQRVEAFMTGYNDGIVPCLK